MTIVHINRHIDRLFQDCEQIELAASHEGEWWRGGIFDDVDAFKAAVAMIGDAADLYTTINQPARRRAHNRLIRGRGLSNSDIERRVRIAFDLDPVRAAGFEKYAASEREQCAAIHIACRLADDFVAKAGWPDPAIVFSGNGAHVIFKADIPVDAETNRILKILYAGVATYFGTPRVHCDTAVQNPARILRLPGTWNVGKASSADRPMRQARAQTPDRWGRAVTVGDIVDLMRRYGMDVDYKRKVGAKRAQAVQINGAGDYRTLDVVAWFEAHNHYKQPMSGGKHAATCPWHAEHSTPDTPDGTGTVIWEADTGWPTFHCSHNHCDGRTLTDVMVKWGDADRFCSQTFSVGRFQCTA